MIDPETLPYRPCAGVMLFNRAGLVFVGRRIDTTQEVWQLPQGGIDEGEAPLDAAIRELAEETGVQGAVLLGKAREWLSYDLPAELVGKVWEGRYRGQRQKWFAMRFDDADTEIDVETVHPEFDAWRWTPIDELVGKTIAFKRAVYQAVIEEFREFAAPA